MPLLLALVACQHPSKRMEEHPPPPDSTCVEPGDPPGDPIYRDCRVRRDGYHGTYEHHTDGEGRTIAWTADDDAAGTSHGTQDWEGPCLVGSVHREIGDDGAQTSLREEVRTCDDAGNETSLVTTTTTWEDGEPLTTTVRTTTSYTYDDAGRPLVAVTTEEGSEDPPVVTTCEYSAWDGPDRCVEDYGSDIDLPVETTWTYDADGLVIEKWVHSVNPGWYTAEWWERDEHGRPLVSGWRDGNLGPYERAYTYDGAVLRSVGSPMGGDTDIYTYSER